MKLLNNAVVTSTAIYIVPEVQGRACQVHKEQLFQDVFQILTFTIALCQTDLL